MKLPYMPLYADTFLMEAAPLTLEEVGAFIILASHMWVQKGSIKDDDEVVARLLRIKPSQWIKLKKGNLESLLRSNGRRLALPPLQELYEQQLKKTEAARENGRKGAEKRKENKEACPARPIVNSYNSVIAAKH